MVSVISALSKNRQIFRTVLFGGLLAFSAACPVGGQTSQAPAESSEQNVQASLQRAVSVIRDQPAGYEQFDYIMTARVRLLLFWAGADDVGGGYIRRAMLPDDPSSKLFQ